MSFARNGIEDLVLYVPGKPIEDVKREYGITGEIIKLASNENPLGASPLAVAAMKAEAENVFLYPEPTSEFLREKLGVRFSVDASQIVFSNGMDDVLKMITQAFINSGDEIITCAPSFASYRIYSTMLQAKFISVPLVNHTFDLDGILEKITERTKLIFICNPNNPTGTIVGKAAVENFLHKVPDHCIVMFDEAYAEFVTDENYESAIRYVHEGKNVIVGRTFSKLYGLAGLRIGYAIAPAHLMNILKRVAEPFPVSRIAQAAALAALRDTEFVQRAIIVNNDSKQYLYDEFKKMNFDCSSANGNFMWVDTHMQSRMLEVELLKRGIIIRPGHLWGFDTHLRISIGTRQQCEALVKALHDIIK